jgi:hypothetical protein
MKALGLALIAALAIGCSSTPTSPTTSLAPGQTVATQDVRPGHLPGTLKVTIYVYSDDVEMGSHLVGMPVTLASVPAGASYTGVTGRQGAISIDVPKASTAVTWTIEPNSTGFCVNSGTLLIPYGVRDNWFAAHLHPDCVS